MNTKKFWRRFFLILILVPFVLLGGVVLYFQSNQSEIFKKELAKLNEDHNGLIRVGATELSLWRNFPYISIKAYDVQIFESKTAGSSVIMDVEDVYVGFSLLDILNGDYDIQSLLVEEGFFNIVIHENNTTNIQNSLQSSSDIASTPPAIRLREITFKNLDVHTLDEATNTDVEKFIYSGTGGFRQKDSIIAGHIDTDLELNVIKDGDTTFIHNKHFEVHTDLIFNTYTGILDIQPSGIVMENGDFELKGAIDTKNDVDLDLSIKGTKPNFDMLMAFAPTDMIPLLEKYKNAGDIYFNAIIQGKANKGNRPFIDAHFGASKAFLENTERRRKIDRMGFNGHFTNGENRDASTMEFSLTDMTASLEKGKFEGAILIKNFESPEVNMQINSNFNIDFIADFIGLDQVKDASGEVSLKMNFHDIIDIDKPEKALEKLDKAYFTELIIKDFSLVAKQLPVPLHDLNAHLIMNGQEGAIKQLELQVGNSDISINGLISDLPAIVHHTSIPVETHLEIASNYLDLAELTGFSKKDTTQTGIDEQIKNLSLGLTFKASAKDFTESEYFPRGTFLIDSLFADLTHYPHKLHDFSADIRITDKDLEIEDFTGYIDDSDFHFEGFIHDYSFWMQPELNGDVDLDINLTSNKLRLEDLFSYQGENYVPKQYRHEIFDDLSLHFTAGMQYRDSHLHSIDVALDNLDTKMELHPQRFHDFRGSIHYEDQHIQINDFHGEIGATNFNFDLNYYLGEDLGIKKRDNRLNLKANYIDFDALFDFKLSPATPDEVVVSKNADVKEHAEAFNLYELPFTDMEFEIDIAHFIHHRIDLQNIQAHLRMTPDHYIYIDTLNLDAAGGNIKLDGYFNGSDPEHIYMQPNLVITDVDLDKLLFKFENFGQDHLVSDNLQGKLSSIIKGKIRVYPDMVPDLDQSTIEMEVTVLNGRLKNFDPMMALSDYMGDKNLQNIRFDTLQNSLDINKGRIYIPTMTIESTLGHMELSGTHDMDENIDYYLRVPWKTVRKAAWQKLFKNKRDTLNNQGQEDEIVEVDRDKRIKYLSLKIKGQLDDYKVSLGKKKEK